MNNLELSVNWVELSVVVEDFLNVGSDVEFIPFDEVVHFVIQENFLSLVVENFGLEFLDLLLDEISLLFEFQIPVYDASFFRVKLT